MEYKVLVPAKRCKGEIREKIIGYISKDGKLVGKIISEPETWTEDITSDEKLDGIQKSIIVSKCRELSYSKKGNVFLDKVSNRRFYI